MKCDELKAYTYDDMLDGNADVDIEYYPKSEADNVISGLEQQIEALQKEKKIIRDLYIGERDDCRIWSARAIHHKYKWCLAMARIAQDDWHLHNSFYAMGHQEFEKRKCELYEKWHKRWLAIAEKLKPISTAQQGKEEAK